MDCIGDLFFLFGLALALMIMGVGIYVWVTTAIKFSKRVWRWVRG
jgi:hypothetical protein